MDLTPTLTFSGSLPGWAGAPTHPKNFAHEHNAKPPRGTGQGQQQEMEAKAGARAPEHKACIIRSKEGPQDITLEQEFGAQPGMVAHACV